MYRTISIVAIAGCIYILIYIIVGIYYIEKEKRLMKILEFISDNPQLSIIEIAVAFPEIKIHKVIRKLKHLKYISMVNKEE
jgi:hypothetical protein